jgi:hypothetical protein
MLAPPAGQVEADASHAFLSLPMRSHGLCMESRAERVQWDIYPSSIEKLLVARNKPYDEETIKPFHVAKGRTRIGKKR